MRHQAVASFLVQSSVYTWLYALSRVVSVSVSEDLNVCKSILCSYNSLCYSLVSNMKVCVCMNDAILYFTLLCFALL